MKSLFVIAASLVAFGSASFAATAPQASTGKAKAATFMKKHSKKKGSKGSKKSVSVQK